jgi:hypothetical protein
MELFLEISSKGRDRTRNTETMSNPNEHGDGKVLRNLGALPHYYKAI